MKEKRGTFKHNIVLFLYIFMWQKLNSLSDWMITFLIIRCEPCWCRTYYVCL